MPLDRATRDYLERSGSLAAPRVYEVGAAPARAGMTARQLSDPPGPAVARVVDTTARAEGGPITLRRLLPRRAAGTRAPDGMV
jgi:hypothetical protein